MHCRTKMSYGLKAHILEDIQVGAQSSQVKSVIRAPIPLGSRHWYIPNTSHISMQGSVFNSCWYCSERTITVTQHHYMCTFSRANKTRSWQSWCSPWVTLQQPGDQGYKSHRSQESPTAGCFWGETPLLKAAKWQLQSPDVLRNFRRGVAISKSRSVDCFGNPPLILYCHPLLSAASQTMTSLGSAKQSHMLSFTHWAHTRCLIN